MNKDDVVNKIKKEAEAWQKQGESLVEEIKELQILIRQKEANVNAVRGSLQACEYLIGIFENEPDNIKVTVPIGKAKDDEELPKPKIVIMDRNDEDTKKKVQEIIDKIANHTGGGHKPFPDRTTGELPPEIHLGYSDGLLNNEEGYEEN